MFQNFLCCEPVCHLLGQEGPAGQGGGWGRTRGFECGAFLGSVSGFGPQTNGPALGFPSPSWPMAPWPRMAPGQSALQGCHCDILK